MDMNKKFYLIALAAVLCAAACDVMPAEEVIEDTGALNFVASFNTPAGVYATWQSSDKVLVLDSSGKLTKFNIDEGAGRSEASFSGEITPASSVRHVIYAHDPAGVSFDHASSTFSIKVPDVYSAKETGALVTANNAAIGILSGSEVSLQSLCGFVKFTLEGNGQVATVDGVSYPLTDLRRVIFTSNDGNPFAGVFKAVWKDGDTAPSLMEVVDGKTSVSFNTRSVTTRSGDVFYVAGDYYIPVAPFNYEDVSIAVEDVDGDVTTAVSKRAISVLASMTSNINTISWPTIVLEANFNCSSVSESQTHADVNAFPNYNYEVDRVSETTGEKRLGLAYKKTVVDFVENGVNYQLWATNGYARYFVTGNILKDIIFNNYYTGWKNDNDTWTGGSMHGYAWIRIPENPGILYRIELQILSKGTGPVTIATQVDPDTGAPLDNLFTIPVTSKSSFRMENIVIANAKKGAAYYIVMGDSYYYRVRSWKLYYKQYDK